MWRIQTKHRKMQRITEVWILSASYRDKCSGWILIGPSVTCAVMHTEQGQPGKPASPESPAVPRHTCKPPRCQCSRLPPLPGRSNAVLSTLCTRGFSSGQCIVNSFPSVLLQWIALVKRFAPGAHPLPSVQFCNLCCHLVAPGSPPGTAFTVIKARRHLWLFPKSVMMEVVRRCDQTFGKHLLAVEVFLKLASTTHRRIWPVRGAGGTD